MKYFNVVGYTKATKQKIIIEPHLTEAQAMVMCESWGWMYDDGAKAYNHIIYGVEGADEELDGIED